MPSNEIRMVGAAGVAPLKSDDPRRSCKHRCRRVDRRGPFSQVSACGRRQAWAILDQYENTRDAKRCTEASLNLITVTEML